MTSSDDRLHPGGDRLPFVWPRARSILGAVFAAVSVLALQVALSAFYWVGDPSPAAALAPTWDTAGIALLLFGWAALRPGMRMRWPDRAVVIGLSAVVFVYFVIGLGQGFALREFGYDVVLRLHVAYVPELFRMMYGAEPLGTFILYCALLALGVIAIVAAIYASVRHLFRFARHPAATRRRQVGLAGAAAAAFALGAALLGVRGPITVEAYDQLDMALNLDARRNTTARRIEIEAAPLRNASPFARPGAERPTILIFVVESYGQVLFTDREFAEFPGWLNGLGASLTGAGYHIASKQLTSPVFGGSSWLAGTSLMCGVRINNQKRFEGLMASQVRCLPAFLNEAGYRTVVAAANTKRRDAPYERRLPFQQYYIRDDFGYRGPRLGWSFVPDQHAIDVIHRREIAPRLTGGAAAARANKPLMVAYFLTTSHHPWSIVPPFIEDWSAIGDGSIYAVRPATNFGNQFVAGSDYKTAYRTSVQYSLRTVASYLERLPADDRSVILVLGDHQPRRPVARMKGDPWTVPIHLLSRDPAALERFARVGFRPGLIPAAEKAPSGLEKFVVELFAAYGEGPAPGTR